MDMALSMQKDDETLAAINLDALNAIMQLIEMNYMIFVVPNYQILQCMFIIYIEMK